jgi:hypothetical protein
MQQLHVRDLGSRGSEAPKDGRILSKPDETEKPLFDPRLCDYGTAGEYETTMRMTVRRSFSGCDFGERAGTQFTPRDYRSLGEQAAKAIAAMFLDQQ